ncbi:MAG: hypothetical protein COW66_02950 [Flavobacteriaceae bacterium CG18_big_fil_WC_8_21_14_2_50_34_36]|nr:MAG: hypothetical protein COW66_02950 [Flavobacteriaceae bacterium CG18_big_fil_WC_8_21_14_2_50_34_36]
MMYLNQIQKSINKSIAMVLLTVFFLTEAYGKIVHRYFYDKSDIAKYIKLVVLLFLIAACLRYLRQFKLIGLLFVVFLVGQLTISNGFQNEIIVVFAKFLFPLFIFLYFNNNLESSNNKELLFKTFEWLMVINSVLMLIGILLSIKLFKTYQGSRFGYNGAFYAASTGSYAYIITLMYFLLRYKEKVIKNWKFILIFISCIFIGTKAVYLAIAFTIVYTIIISKIPFKKTLIAVASLSVLLLAYYFFFHFGIFNTIRQKESLFTALMSYRDEQFWEITLPYIKENWSWINYLIGGVTDFDLRSQMDLIDVFFFWGILGGALYLYLFFRLFLPFKMNSTSWVFISFLAFIVLLAGNFFVYSFVALFLVVLKLILQDKNNIKL